MRADARLKRAQIIEAAMGQFRTRPASRVTMEGIAADAGVGIATVYRHFPSRAALRQACALALIEVLEEFLSETLDSFDADPVDNWEGFVWRSVDFGVGMLVGALVEELPAGARGGSGAGGLGAGPGDPAVAAKLDQFFGHVEVLLSRAASFGLVDPALTPIELASELIVVTRPMDPQFTALFPDVRDRLVRHLLVAWRCG